MPTPVRPLNANQVRFVEELLLDGIAGRAYERAGYKAKGAAADANAARLLADPRVQQLLAEQRAARAKRAGIKADRVLCELAAVATSDIGDIIDFSGDAPRLKAPSEIPARARRAISSVKIRREKIAGEEAGEFEIIEFKLWDKPGTLKTIAQHLGMLVHKHEHTGKDGAPLGPQTLTFGDVTVTF